MTTQAGRALFAGSPMATVRTRAALIGEIGAASSPNPRWPNTQSTPARSGRSVDVRFSGARNGRASGRRCATARSAAAAAVPASPIPMGWPQAAVRAAGTGLVWSSRPSLGRCRSRPWRPGLGCLHDGSRSGCLTMKVIVDLALAPFILSC
jgi:hypothetical protein